MLLERWKDLGSRAENQHGLLTTSQILGVLSRHQLATGARHGVIVPAAHGVWRLSGAPPTRRQRIMAACLSIGRPVAASGPTAGELWDFEDIAGIEEIHLTVPRRRGNHSSALVVVHRHVLDERDVDIRHGIPVTRPLRTLLDLATVLSLDVLALCVDAGMRRGVIQVRQMREAESRWQGHVGWPALAAALDPRLEGGVGDSHFEERVFRWLVAAGLPTPVRQFQVELPGRLALLDLAYPKLMVGVECEGWKWHNGRRRFDHDRARMSELALAGWLMISVTSAHAREEVVDRVRRALSQGELREAVAPKSCP